MNVSVIAGYAVVVGILTIYGWTVFSLLRLRRDALSALAKEEGPKDALERQLFIARLSIGLYRHDPRYRIYWLGVWRVWKVWALLLLGVLCTIFLSALWLLLRS